MTAHVATALNRVLATTVALLAVGLSYQAYRLARQHQQLEDLNQNLAHTQRQLVELAEQQAHTDTALTAARQTLISRSNATAIAAKPSELQSWLDRVSRLKEWLQQHPEKNIPEMRFLDSNDWLMVTLDTSLDSDAKIRAALSKLRSAAKTKPEISANISQAIQAYAKAHNGHPASSASALRPYLNPALEDAILQRYTVVPPTPTENRDIMERQGIRFVGAGQLAFQETAVVDEDYDTVMLFLEKGGIGVQGTSKLGDTVSQAERAFSKANNGQAPASVDQLLPFLATPVDETALREFWDTQKK